MTFVNPVSYGRLRERGELLREFDTIFVDGILLALLLRLLRVANPRRVSFDMTSFASELFSRCDRTHESIAFIGNTPDASKRFGETLRDEYPALNITACRSGYMNREEWIDAANDLLADNPDFVVVGMGTPLQEKFMVCLSVACPDWTGQAFSCGGFIHQTQASLHYYPPWVNALHLRMPYRLVRERLYSRLTEYPRFIGQLLIDWVEFLRTRAQTPSDTIAR